MEKVEKMGKDTLVIFTKLHNILKPYIYIISALMLCIAGAYLVVSIVALLQDALQPSWFIATLKWCFILLTIYWTMRIANLAAQAFGK